MNPNQLHNLSYGKVIFDQDHNMKAEEAETSLSEVGKALDMPV